MSEATDFGPLKLERRGRECRFSMAAPDSMLLDLPPDFHSLLAQRLAEIFAREPESTLVFDLHNVPAISSRQLGLMLELQKAARSRYPRLPLTGLSSGVRELLDTTQTVRFFDPA